MVRNEYRRALILLRGNAPGYSGHVRLERRTLMGSLYFNIRAPGNCTSLEAALVGRSSNAYYACPLGTLNKEDNEQMTLSLRIDPRNICGRELEDYFWLAVVCVDEGECQLVLFGNVNGHKEVNWERALTAICALYGDDRARTSVGVLPDPAEAAEVEGAMEKEAPAADDVQEAEKTKTTDKAPSEMMERLSDKAATAAEALGVSADRNWPERVESLREIFRNQPPAADTPDRNYVYVAAPMPAGCGYSQCLAGLHAQDGRLDTVRYALPGVFSVEPPAGLDDYHWLGGSTVGWWALDVPVAENTAD